MYKRQLLHQVDYKQKVYPFSHNIATSPTAKEEIMSYSNLDIENISIIEPGIEDSWKRKSKHSNKIYNLLSVSNYIDRKGLDFLIDACFNLRGLKFELTIVGDKELDQDYYKKLESKINQYDLGNRINLLSTRSRSEINQLMINADYLIQPAKHETFGMAVYEAMISNLPVLMFKTGAWEEFDKSNLVTVIDNLGSEELTERLNEILTESYSLSQSSKTEHRSWKSVALDFEEILLNFNLVKEGKYISNSQWN